MTSDITSIVNDKSGNKPRKFGKFIKIIYICMGIKLKRVYVLFCTQVVYVLRSCGNKMEQAKCDI